MSEEYEEYREVEEMISQLRAGEEFWDGKLMSKIRNDELSVAYITEKYSQLIEKLTCDERSILEHYFVCADRQAWEFALKHQHDDLYLIRHDLLTQWERDNYDRWLRNADYTDYTGFDAVEDSLKKRGLLPKHWPSRLWELNVVTGPGCEFFTED